MSVKNIRVVDFRITRCNNRPYSSLHEAKKHLKDMRRKGVNSVYKCLKCKDTYHLTRLRKNRVNK